MAILQGRVAAVGRLADAGAARVLDAAGRYVCPGFVDMHSHADLTLLVDRRGMSKLRQGVTLDIAGNCGSSAAPIGGAATGAVERRLARWGLDVTWESMEEYLSLLDHGGLGLNYSCFVGHGTLRASVMGYKMRTPSETELQLMRDRLGEAMNAGALGLSSGLIYPPSSYADVREMVELCRVVAEHDGIYSTHMRNEGAGLLDALRETIQVGKESGVRVQVSHLKCSARSHWGTAAEAIALIEEARSEGLDIWADQYPYTASSTGLGVFVPQWAQDGGRTALLERLADTVTRRKIVEEMTAWRVARAPADPDSGWESVVIAGAPNAPQWEGLNVRAIGLALGMPPAEATVELLLLNGGDVQVVIWSMDEGDVRRIMRAPWIMIGSDSETRATDGPLFQGKPHPRGYGTFPRVLARYTRDEGLLSWGEAVHKMTGLSARRLGLKDRGVIAPGAVADLVVLDPNGVRETATFEQPHAYPDGIHDVMVNGRWVIRDGAFSGELPGRVLRMPAARSQGLD